MTTQERREFEQLLAEWTTEAGELSRMSGTVKAEQLQTCADELRRAMERADEWTKVEPTPEA